MPAVMQSIAVRTAIVMGVKVEGVVEIHKEVDPAGGPTIGVSREPVMLVYVVTI